MICTLEYFKNINSGETTVNIKKVKNIYRLYGECLLYIVEYCFITNYGITHIVQYVKYTK